MDTCKTCLMHPRASIIQQRMRVYPKYCKVHNLRTCYMLCTQGSAYPAPHMVNMPPPAGMDGWVEVPELLSPHFSHSLLVMAQCYNQSPRCSPSCMGTRAIWTIACLRTRKGARPPLPVATMTGILYLETYWTAPDNIQKLLWLQRIPNCAKQTFKASLIVSVSPLPFHAYSNSSTLEASPLHHSPSQLHGLNHASLIPQPQLSD